MKLTVYSMHEDPPFGMASGWWREDVSHDDIETLDVFLRGTVAGVSAATSLPTLIAVLNDARELVAKMIITEVAVSTAHPLLDAEVLFLLGQLACYDHLPRNIRRKQNKPAPT